MTSGNWFSDRIIGRQNFGDPSPILARDFIAKEIVAVQSSTTQNTKILDDLTFSNKHFVETSRWVTKTQWQYLGHLMNWRQRVSL